MSIFKPLYFLIVFVFSLPIHSHEIDSIKKNIEIHSNVLSRINNLYQGYYSEIGIDHKDDPLLYLFSHTSDNVGASNSVLSGLQRVTEFCDFWTQHSDQPLLLDWRPQWNTILDFIGNQNFHKDGTLFGKIYALENIGLSQLEMFHATLGQPLDHHQNTFFSYLNQWLGFLIQEPIETILGKRFYSGTYPYSGILGSIASIISIIDTNIHSIESSETLDLDSLESLKCFQKAFGFLHETCYDATSSFTSLTCQMMNDFSQMFPSFSADQFQKLVRYLDARYLNETSKDLASQLAQLETTLSNHQILDSWKILTGNADPLSETIEDDSLFGTMLQIRKVLEGSILRVIGQPGDDFRQETMFGNIALLKEKINYQSVGPALMKSSDLLADRLIFIHGMLEKAAESPINFSLAFVYNCLAVTWQTRMIETISTLQSLKNLEDGSDKLWLQTYLGFEKESDRESSLFGLLNRSLREILVTHIAESIGQMPGALFGDTTSEENFCQFFNKIIDIVKKSEQKRHRDSSSFLLAEVFKDNQTVWVDTLMDNDKFNQQFTIGSLIYILSSAVRDTYLGWDFDFFQYTLKRIARSWNRQVSLSDILFEIQKALPPDPTDDDLKDLKEIFTLTPQILSSETTADWGEFIPYFNQILNKMMPKFIQQAFGTPQSEESFSEDASIFSMVNALSNAPRTQQTWRHSIPDSEIASLQKYKSLLTEIHGIFENAKYNIRPLTQSQVYRFIGGITHPGYASLRKRMIDLFSKLYNTIDTDAESTYPLHNQLAGLTKTAQTFYEALCCPCVTIDKALNAYTSCIEHMTRTIQDSNFLRINGTLLQSFVDTLGAMAEDTTEILNRVTLSQGPVPEYYCRADFVLAPLSKLTNHLATVADHVNTLCWSVSPVTDLVKGVRGYDCAHLAHRITPLSSSVNQFNQMLVQKFMQNSFPPVDADQVLNYQIKITALSSSIQTIAQNFESLCSSLTLNSHALSELCATCQYQPDVIQYLTVLSLSLRELSQNLLLFSKNL